MREKTIGRLHLAGPSAWPDQLLSYEGHGIIGAVIAVGGYAVGFELQGRSGGNHWLNIYAGPWAFEIYHDAEGGLEEGPDMMAKDRT